MAGGETIAAYWVISAADGHATIYDLLGGTYTDKLTHEIYGTLTTFPPDPQVSLGVAQDLPQQVGYLTRLLDDPLTLDPKTHLRRISFPVLHFDPTFAPPGKATVTCVLPTYNFVFWVDLQQRDPARYQTEKHRVTEVVIAILERSVAVDDRPSGTEEERHQEGSRHCAFSPDVTAGQAGVRLARARDRLHTRAGSGTELGTSPLRRGVGSSRDRLWRENTSMSLGLPSARFPT
jgi:hypothetical protein